MQVGSIAIAAWVAPIAFCALMALAVARRRWRVAALFAAFAALGYLGLPRLGAGAFVTSWLAVVDVALVFIVVGHDVRLT